jgi:alkyl sulfatase BDS1-like metallo-beta-lactamase superfamily hydrolase
VAAIIYTHHHADHVLGTAAFVTPEEVRSGKVPIYAHESLMAAYQQENVTLGPIMRMRAAAMYNSLLSGADNEGMNSGIGPLFQQGTPGLIAPTHLVGDKLDLTIAGVELRLVHVPGEASSEIAIYLPQSRILLSAEVIQDHTFPNIYTLRGAVYRDPMQWVRSIDRLRAFSAEEMVLQHGPPVKGQAAVEEVLRYYRDAIQYVRDQTIRWTNHGLHRDEIAARVELPPHLREFRPWLLEFYGSVRHSVPSIYEGNIGWFEGDPVALQPTPRVEAARRMVTLMGGRDRVLEESRKAFFAGEPQFAAELATLLIRISNTDMDARRLKAAAFRKLGYATINSTWRGLYLTVANALENKIDWGPVIALTQARTTGESFAQSFPARALLDTMPPRLKAEETTSVEETYAFRFTDSREEFTLVLRKGIIEVREGLPPSAIATLSGPKAVLGRLVAGASNQDTLLSQLDIAGSREAAARLFGYFEAPVPPQPSFYLR